MPFELSFYVFYLFLFLKNCVDSLLSAYHDGAIIATLSKKMMFLLM